MFAFLVRLLIFSIIYRRFFFKKKKSDIPIFISENSVAPVLKDIQARIVPKAQNHFATLTERPLVKMEGLACKFFTTYQ